MMTHRLTDDEVWLRLLCAGISAGHGYSCSAQQATMALEGFRERFPAPPKANREDLLKAMKGILGGQDKETELSEPPPSTNKC